MGEIAVQECLDEETLAMFDLLKKPELTPGEIKRIEAVAVELLARLKAEKLRETRAEYGKRIVSTLATQLTWSHFIEILPLKAVEAKLFYAQTAAGQRLSAKALREQISRKAFERTAIADAQLVPDSPVPPGTFKDPYLFDFLGLRSDYLENDLETAILRELENFILAFGKGFAFVERQKRMIIDGEDFYLDLLFYHRILQRLVAVELKLGKFQARDKGQMELYLKWLDRYERQEGENAPVSLILCAAGSREQVELLEIHKDGIVVAEYWTELPPKKELGAKNPRPSR